MRAWPLCPTAQHPPTNEWTLSLLTPGVGRGQTWGPTLSLGTQALAPPALSPQDKTQLGSRRLPAHQVFLGGMDGSEVPTSDLSKHFPAALPTQLTPQAHCAMHLEQREGSAHGSPLQSERPQAPLSFCSFYLIKTKKQNKKKNPPNPQKNKI